MDEVQSITRGFAAREENISLGDMTCDQRDQAVHHSCKRRICGEAG